MSKKRNARQLTKVQADLVADNYRQGIGTIHGFASLYDVSIQTIKKTLDEHGIPHGKGRSHDNLSHQMVITIALSLREPQEA